MPSTDNILSHLDYMRQLCKNISCEYSHQVLAGLTANVFSYRICSFSDNVYEHHFFALETLVIVVKSINQLPGLALLEHVNTTLSLNFLHGDIMM